MVVEVVEKEAPVMVGCWWEWCCGAVVLVVTKMLMVVMTEG